jgi:hypothetical protein
VTVVRVPKHEHRLPQARRRRKAVMLFLTEDELRRLDAAAEAVGMPRATYMRWRLLYAPGRATRRAVPPVPP